MSLSISNLSGKDSRSYITETDSSLVTVEESNGRPEPYQTWWSLFRLDEFTRPQSNHHLVLAPSIQISRLWLAQAGVGQTAPAEPTPTEQAGEHVVPKEAVKLYEQGMALRKKGKWEKAKVLFEKAIEIDPKFYEARIERGLMLFNLDKKEEADAEFKKVLHEDPDNISVKVASTVFLVFDPEREDYEKAGRILEEVLKADPNNVHANYYMAFLLIKKEGEKGYEKAIVYLQRIKDVDPDNVRYLENLEILFYKTGRKETTIPNLKETLNKYPDQPFINGILASLYMMENRPADAIPHLRRTVAQKPGLAFIQYGLGHCLHATQRSKDAIPYLEKAVELDPNHLEAHSLLGMIYFSSQEYERAITHLKRATELGSDNLSDYFVLACLYHDQDRWEEALPYYEKALRLEVDFRNQPNRYADYLNLLIEKERYGEALAVARKCISMVPDEPFYHHYYVRALLETTGAKREVFEAAARDYEALFKKGLNKDWRVYAAFDLALIYILELERYDDAIRLGGDLFSAGIGKEGIFRAHSILGLALARKEKFKEALPHFEKAYSLDPDNEAILQELGLVYKELGDYEKAVGMFVKLIEIMPDHIYAYSWLASSYVSLERFQEAISTAMRAIERDPAEAEIKSEVHRWHGVSLAYAGRHEEAILEFKKALELDSSQWIRDDIAESLIALGRTREAIKMLEQEVSENPGNRVAVFELYEAFVDVHDYDHAISFMVKFVEENPNDMTGLRKLAEAYERNGLYDKAVPVRRKIVGLDPDNYRVHTLFAYALDKAGQFQEAKAEYELAIRLNPKDEQIYYFYGRLLVENNQPRKTIEILQKGLEVAPNSARLHWEMAMGYDGLRDYERAFHHCKEVIKYGEKVVQAGGHVCLAVIHLGDERYREAEKEFRKALELDPKNEIALSRRGLGELFLIQKRYREAMKELRLAKELDPSNSGVRVALAKSLYFNNDLDGAVAELQGFLSVHRGNEDAYIVLATCFEEKGEEDKAVAVYKKGLTVFPDNPSLINNFGYTLAKMGRIEEATGHLSKALELAPGDPNIQDSLGYAYFKMGRYDEALELYRRSAKKFEEAKEESYEVLLHLGIALLQKSEVDEAIAYLERSLEANPKDKETQEALRAARDIKAGKVVSDIPTPSPLREGRRLASSTYTKDLQVSTGPLDEIEREMEERLRTYELDLLAKHSRRLLGGQQPAEAVVLLRRSIEIDPGNSRLYAQLGDALMELGRYDQAIGNYEEALKFDSRNARARRGLEKALKMRKASLSSLVKIISSESMNPQVTPRSRSNFDQ